MYYIKTLSIKHRIESKCCFCNRFFTTYNNNGIHEKTCPECDAKMYSLFFKEKHEPSAPIYVYCQECKNIDTEACFCYNKNIVITGCVYGRRKNG